MPIYTKFITMIVTSTALMLAMMYFNTFQFDHIFFSETRFYMAIYMGALMAVVMLLFMLNMYKSKKKNLAVFFRQFIDFCCFAFFGSLADHCSGPLMDEGNDPPPLHRNFNQ